MTSRSGKPVPGTLFDGLFIPLGDWGHLLDVAQELRSIDSEFMDTMLEAYASGPRALSPYEITKVRSLVQLLKQLDLDPAAICRELPETMHELETTCVGCTQRTRCDHELAAGTAAVTYQRFCPNAQRLMHLVEKVGP
ncbi:heavy-metal resistance [Methylobacterium durans]|uniref:Heavy-metal resistance n=1 Tax=Methylobacterium durans TaxID=2202825 RepID=A0A2U8WG83_9HYPH|nr:heavy-metal resistance [Methylobacterium durans]AWN44326.1 heavy-metal resistance [Methylobacterium durans]